MNLQPTDYESAALTIVLRVQKWWTVRDLNPTEILRAKETTTPSSPEPHMMVLYLYGWFVIILFVNEFFDPTIIYHDIEEIIGPKLV